LFKVIGRATARKEAFDIEHRLQMPDGSVKHLHVVAHAFVDEPQNLQFAGAVMDITAAKEAERALRQSETRYQNLFQAMAVSFFEVDYTSSRQILRELRDAGVVDFRRHFKENPGLVREIMRATRVVDVNDQTLALFGRGNKDELLTSVAAFWPEESFEDYVEAVLASVERNEEYSAETRMRRLDGTIFDAQFTLRYATEDKTKGLAGVIDISARKQAEQTLRGSEARLAEAERELRLTLDSIPAITWRGARNGYVQYLNKRWFDYTGTTPEQVRGWRWKLCVHPDDVDHLVDVGNRYVASGTPIDAEARLRRFDGEYRWFLFRPAPARDEFGSIIGWYGTITDIEERKRAEGSLRKSERRYQNLFQAMAVSFMELDFSRVGDLLRTLRASGIADFRQHLKKNPESVRQFMRAARVVDVNDQTVALFGQGARERLLENVEPFWPDESVQGYAEAILSSLEGKRSYSVEVPLRRVDGSMFDAQFTVWYSPDDRKSGLGAVIDITARKQASLALERSEQRYRHLFNHMPVALWQLNARGVLELFKQLRSEAVTDLGAYFDAHPGLLQRCMEMLIIEEVNEHTVQMLGGRDKSQIVGTSIARYFPDNSATFRHSMVSRYRGDPSYAAETKLFTLDGRSVDVLYTASRVGPISEPGMSLLGVIDITERKQAEEALRRSEQRYQNLFQAMAVSLWELDYTLANDMLRSLHRSGVADFAKHFKDNPDAVRELVRATRVVDVNDQTIELFGRGRHKDEFLTTLEPFLPEESWEDYIAGVVSATGGSASFSTENRFRRLDGTLFDGHITIRYAPEGKTSGLAGIIDITARKQAFLALEKSEQRYRHLFRNTPVALWQLNAQPLVAMFRELRASGVEDLSAYIAAHPDFLSRVLSALIVEEVNDHAIRLFGAQDEKELIGYPTHWIWRESMDTLQRALESRWRGEESFQEATKLVTRDGRIIDVLYSAARPQMIEGLPISLVSMIDLTERVRAQEELRRMQADFAHAARISILGELTASIAHEVNQPLAAIAAGGEASLRWLARSTPDIAEVKELTKRTVADARRASEIVARIRSMAARRQPEQMLLSLDDVIREALLFLRHETESRGVAVSHFPALGQQKVAADRTQLQQVIVNLAINAMQAMAQAGSQSRDIAIRTVVPDPAALRCSVEDSGPGIAPDHNARLFDSFFTTKDSGMGMGLRICRSIVEAHGGKIEVDNNSALGGARFSFTLPVAPSKT
jgi:PAS domain S-box-containing protein